MGMDFNIPYGAERWVPLNYNGTIIPRYSISDHGRIYDHYESKFKQTPYKQDDDGYYLCSIKINDKEYKKIRVHRIELMSFNFIPNFIEMQVNHKDGNKQNLLLSNLEWMTPIENTRHGWDTGLNQCIGLKNGKAIHDENIIRQICELLDQGCTNAQICNYFGITDKGERMKLSATVSGVKHGKTHRYISCDYHFLNNINVQNRYSLDFAHLVCQFLSDPNRNYTYKEIMDFLQIPNEERINFKVYINDLIRGRTAKNITEQYNLKRPLDGDTEYGYLMR